MRYLVTGATGHIGNNMVRLLINKHEDVKILVRNIDDVAIKDLNCEKVIGDITDLNCLEQFIEPDSIVIHCAGVIDITNKLSALMMKVNYQATIDLVNICIKKKIKKFIYLSSTDALNSQSGLIKEPLAFGLDNLNNGYAISKAKASQYVLDCINEKIIDGTIICPSCVIGINDYKPSAQGMVFKKQLNKKHAFSTKGHYNFVDVEEVVKAIYQTTQKECQKIYLVTGVDVSVNELFSGIFKELDKKCRITYVPLGICKIFVGLIGLYDKLKKQKRIYTKMALEIINQKRTFDNTRAIVDLGLKVTPYNVLAKKTLEWFKNN